MKRLVSILLLLLALSSTCLAQAGQTQDAPLDNKRIGFAPTVVHHANLAAQDVTTWSGLPGQATVTTGVKAPDGTTGAATLSINSPITGGRLVYSGPRTLRVGDWLMFGTWVKAVSVSPPGASVDGQAVARVTASDPTAGYKFDIDSLNFRELRVSVKADTEWEWVTSAAKVIAAPSTPTATVEFELQCANTKTLAFYAPVLHHIEAGEATDAEARALLQNLYSVPDGVPVGGAALLRGQTLYCYNAGTYSPCSFGGAATGDLVLEDATPTLEFRDTDGADFIHELNAGNYFLRFVGGSTMLAFNQPANRITVQTGVAFRADSIELATGILDTDLNELLKTSPTVSAVNEFTITNAATGNGPKLSATGGDTNIPLELQAKGDADVRIKTQIGRGLVVQAIGATDAPFSGFANSSGTVAAGFGYALGAANYSNVAGANDLIIRAGSNSGAAGHLILSAMSGKEIKFATGSNDAGSQNDTLKARIQSSGGFSINSTQTQDAPSIGLNNDANNAAGSAQAAVFQTTGSGQGALRMAMEGATVGNLRAFEITKFDGSVVQRYFRVDVNGEVQTSAGYSSTLANIQNAKTITLGGQYAQNVNTVGNVGAGQDTLHSYTIPANVLANDGDTLDFLVSGNLNASAGTQSKEVGGSFGGTFFLLSGNLAETGGASWSLKGTIMRIDSDSVLITWQFVVGNPVAVSQNQHNVSQIDSLNFGASLTLAFTGEDKGTVPTNNTVTARGSLVRKFARNNT